jgi:signal transduction histidine kinase
MRWTIRAKLTALVLVVLLPLMAGAAVKFWHDVAEERGRAQQEMLATAQSVARHVDEALSGQIEHLHVLAALRSLHRITDEDLATLAARIRRDHPFMHRFLVATPDGVVTASSGRRVPQLAGAFADAGVLADVLSRGEPRVGPPQPSQADGRLVVPLVVPILDNQGAPLGVVAAEIDLQGLSAFLDRIRLARDVSQAIVTEDGRVLARSGGALGLLGHRIPAPPGVAALIERRQGVAEWAWDDRTRSVVGAASTWKAPWVVIAALPSDLAYGPAAARLRTNLIVLAALTCAGLLAAWLISRRMAASAQALIEGARSLAAGQAPPIRVPTADELAELAEQFNRAMEAQRFAQLEVETRQRRLRALADVNLSLSRELDLRQLLRQITHALASLTGAQNVVLWEVDHAAHLLIRRTWTADASVGSVDLPSTLTMDQGGTGWIARNREPLFVEDVTKDPRIMAVDWALRHDLVAFAGVPVVAGDELLGVLTLNLKRGRLPYGDDRSLLSSFASQAAVAIRNARLFAEAERRRHEAETLADLGRAVAQALDPDVVAQRIAESVCGLLNARNSALYRLEPESGAFVAVAVWGDVGPTWRERMVFASGTGMVGLALRERKAVTTPNVLTDPRVELTAESRERIERAPYRSVLAVPLVVKERIIGALAVGDAEGRVFAPEEARLAQAFADQAALALENARLYEEAQRRLRHVDSLRAVVEQILVPFSLDERLALIARKTAELFDADRATIALRDPERDRLVVRAGFGLNPGEVGRVLELGTGGLGMAVARREGVLVNDYPSWPHRDPYIVRSYASRPAQAVIAYPLLINEEVIGAISVGLHAPGHRFEAADLERLASLAAPAALAIEHSRLYEELEARLRQLQDTQAQLVQAGKLSAMGQLVSGVAHELNNPLSVVIGYGQLLMNRDLPPEIRRPIELMVSQGERMAKIVQNLLLFSRQRKPEWGAVDLRKVVEETIGLRAAQLMLSGIRVETRYGEAVPPAAGDAHQLQQVLLNLLLNAEQAILGSGAGGARVGDRIGITVEARPEGDRTWVVVEVEDNGPGIPAEILPRIFDPFFTTKKVGEGTGLGLSVSYGIVQQHGGRLAAASEPGRTIFTMELPAFTGVAVEAPGPPSLTTLTGRGRRALVVDDEPDVVHLVATLLRETGWEVDVAASGRSALERLRRRRYDLVVSDIRMPDGTGEDFYRAALAEHGEQATRFLFITGDTANPEAWRFIEQARVPVLEKPFTPQAFLRAVERVTP